MDKRKIAEIIYTIACDDIRHEMGNKVSLMGIYDDLVVDEVPILLPKIHLAIIIRKLKFKFKTILVTFKNPNGDVIDLPEFKLRPNSKIGSNHNMNICIAPLKIEKPGKFVWEIKIDGEKKPSFKHEMIVRSSKG